MHVGIVGVVLCFSCKELIPNPPGGGVGVERYNLFNVLVFAQLPLPLNEKQKDGGLF